MVTLVTMVMLWAPMKDTVENGKAHFLPEKYLILITSSLS